MAFLFSLAAVLRYRKSREDEERRRLQALYRQRAGLQQEMRQSDDARARLRTSLTQSLQQARMAALEIQLVDMGCNRLERRRLELQVSLSKLQAEMLLQAQRYHQERRKCAVLEKLRDDKLREYRANERRREQAEVDELFLLRRIAAETKVAQ